VVRFWGLPSVFNFGDFWQLWQFWQSLCGPLPAPPQPNTTPPGLLPAFVENKGRTRNRSLRGPCVTLGPPLGDAWVTQGPPKPNPKRSAEGCDSPKAARRKDRTGFQLFSRRPKAAVEGNPLQPGAERSKPKLHMLANCQLLTALFSKSFLETSHPWALPEYSCFV
jgi:hypothetical protein